MKHSRGKGTWKPLTKFFKLPSFAFFNIPTFYIVYLNTRIFILKKKHRYIFRHILTAVIIELSILNCKNRNSFLVGNCLKGTPNHDFPRRGSRPIKGLRNCIKKFVVRLNSSFSS